MDGADHNLDTGTPSQGIHLFKIIPYLIKLIFTASVCCLENDNLNYDKMMYQHDLKNSFMSVLEMSSDLSVVENQNNMDKITDQ